MENIQNKEEYQSIKPKVNGFILVLQSIFAGLFFWAPFAGFGGFWLYVIFGLESLIILPIVFVFFFLISLLLTKSSYEEMEYKFYKDRVEYVDGFFVKNKKAIKYENIVNISQTRGILIDRIFNLGKINIYTAGASFSTGLRMVFIENPDYVYDWIIKITSKEK